MEDTETSLPTNTMKEIQKGVRVSNFKFYQDSQGEWMEQTRGSLLVAASVMATLTFQIAVNPPGGVWQSDSQSPQGCTGTTCKAGTSVLSASSDKGQKLKFEAFILLCTISFSAAQAIILVLICGFPLRNRLVMWLILIAMCISVIGTAGAYVVSIWMIMHPVDHNTVYNITLYYAFFWAGLASLLCLGLFSRVMLMLLRKFLRFFCPLLRRFSRYLCDVNE